MEILIIGIISYLMGSIPFGLILTKIFLKKDIREVGSGNIGATNVLRTGNKSIGYITLVLDILKAIALGADNTFIGRAMSYGLGASGILGCEKALKIMHTELDMTMALCGHKNLKEVNKNILKI